MSRMMRRWAFAAAAVASSWTPAWAWGPRADVAIVRTAAQMISRDGAIPLTKLLKDIQDGASVPVASISAIVPEVESGLIPAIESEMYILQAVRGERVDPYFAYRLGVLGKLVAMATAPMVEAAPAYRDPYYADVDNNIDRVVLKPAPRTVVDATYLARTQRTAAEREPIIQQDYRDGLGFQGAAAAGLSEDASRSINAVADVWYSVLKGTVKVVNLSESRVNAYLLDSLSFYVRRGNTAEVSTAYKRVLSKLGSSPDVLTQVGNMFYEAGQRERAMQEYAVVLAAEPHRKEVARRVADYYTSLGDEAFASGKLEAAKAAFAQAREADKLDENIQAKLVQAEKAIAERDRRLQAAQEALEQARALEAKAEQEAARGAFADATAALRQADNLYANVPEEFADEKQVAVSGRRRVASRMRELSAGFTTGAARLSGAGATTDVTGLAAAHARPLSEQALRDMVTRAYETEIQRIKAAFDEKLATPGLTKK